MHRDTLLQHLGEEEKHKGAVVPPIYQNSLFVYDRYEDFATAFDRHAKGEGDIYFYARHGNPTMTILEKKVAALEEMESAKVFCGGMAAITAAIMATVRQGSHVVCLNTAYGPTHRFLAEYLPNFGVTTTFVDGLSPESVLDALRPETTMVYLESPSSLIFRLQDLAAITASLREKKVVSILDNSYATPIYQVPSRFGIDVVVHSATKYMAGHSDITAGVVAGSQAFVERLIRQEIDLFGGLIAPFPAWLMLRGMRTLPLRMKHAQEQGNRVAGWLREQLWVERVNHVGFEDHPQRAIRDTQMSGTSSLLSFEPKNQSDEWFPAFLNALEVYQMGVSWGGFESLAVGFPYHPSDWAEPRQLIRLYNGLEDAGDLIADLTQAAEIATQATS